MAWNPFGVLLEISATAGTVTRTSATQFTVALNVAWETYYSGAQTNYGMKATSGGVTKTISSFGTSRSSGSAQFTGTYSISGNAGASKTITVTFNNFNTDNGDSANKNVSLTVNVPAWTSYSIKYNANGGSGAPSAQTKWKGQTLKLSTTKPTRTGYTFKNWNTASGGSGTSYASGANYTANAAATLYAQWTANTYTVTYNVNGGSGAPANQTKTYGTALTLSSTKPTRSGYNFKGWATSANGAVAYASGASYTTNANITLYAVWEVAYVDPKITGVSITRNGETAIVKFNWQTYNADPYIIIEWETETSPISYITLVGEGTSGSVNQTISGLDANALYALRITVEDSEGTLTVSKTMAGATFPIGMLPNNNGISFGKSPELVNYADFGYKTKHRESVEFENNKSIYGIKPTGELCEALIPSNANGDTILGWDNYDNQNGQTNIYGYDMLFGISNMAEPGTYKPYRRRGDYVNIDIKTTGYVTNAKTEVWFWIPFTEPIIGSPIVTATSGSGFILRQGEKYTHGSAASTYVTPTSYETWLKTFNGVQIKATFSNTTNAINNDTIGIHWNGTITFS